MSLTSVKVYYVSSQRQKGKSTLAPERNQGSLWPAYYCPNKASILLEDVSRIEGQYIMQNVDSDINWIRNLLMTPPGAAQLI